MAVCAAAGQTRSGVESGIEGIITVSPAQPGPTRIDAPGSVPLANAAFVVENNNAEVASFSTDEKGRFRLTLPPGHYKASLKGRKTSIGRFGPFEFDVALRENDKCPMGMRLRYSITRIGLSPPERR